MVPEMSFTRTILVTGGISGLGFECAPALASQNPKTLELLASRTDSNSASTTINTHNNVKFLPLDLSMFAPSLKTNSSQLSTNPSPDSQCCDAIFRI
jgi:NAD(P)-dependent dehydrogenase (short-subunit alcohol dehydrogenase family)